MTRAALFAAVAVGFVLTQAIVGRKATTLKLHVAGVERALDAIITLLVGDTASAQRLVPARRGWPRIVDSEQ
jgi:hypothetical protein